MILFIFAFYINTRQSKTTKLFENVEIKHLKQHIAQL